MNLGKLRIIPISIHALPAEGDPLLLRPQPLA